MLFWIPVRKDGWRRKFETGSIHETRSEKVPIMTPDMASLGPPLMNVCLCGRIAIRALMRMPCCFQRETDTQILRHTVTSHST